MTENMSKHYKTAQNLEIILEYGKTSNKYQKHTTKLLQKVDSKMYVI